jgi:hypothetical protein
MFETGPRGGRHFYVQKSPRNFTFFLFLTGCFIMGSIFTKRLSFFCGKSIREYFMNKSGSFRNLFVPVGETGIIKFPTKKNY